MKKLIIVITLLLFTGCTQVLTEPKEDFSRFVEVERTESWCVVYDRRTKVMYSVANGVYNRGTFTLLVDANGNPLLWEGATE